MAASAKKIIAVTGATGAQGGGVVDALLSSGKYEVRAITRDPSSEKGKALTKKGAKAVKGDFNDPASLESAFKGAHGLFLVTNFWEAGVGEGEVEQAKKAIEVAKKAGVKHIVWSTLPNVKKISGGKFDVPHFTGKAELDDVIAKAGFPHYTFAEPPFYFQNLVGMMAPQLGDDGVKTWNLPIDPTKKVVHGGDIHEFGKLVARAFDEPKKAGNGEHLAMNGSFFSFNELIATLKAQGHKVAFNQVPGATFDGFFPGAKEIREMMDYWTVYTYFGPNAKKHIEQANALVPGGFTSFEKWAKTNFK